MGFLWKFLIYQFGIFFSIIHKIVLANVITLQHGAPYVLKNDFKNYNRDQKIFNIF